MGNSFAIAHSLTAHRNKQCCGDIDLKSLAALHLPLGVMHSAISALIKRSRTMVHLPSASDQPNHCYYLNQMIIFPCRYLPLF